MGAKILARCGGLGRSSLQRIASQHAELGRLNGGAIAKMEREDKDYRGLASMVFNKEMLDPVEVRGIL